VASATGFKLLIDYNRSSCFGAMRHIFSMGKHPTVGGSCARRHV